MSCLGIPHIKDCTLRENLKRASLNIFNGKRKDRYDLMISNFKKIDGQEVLANFPVNYSQ